MAKRVLTVTKIQHPVTYQIISIGTELDLSDVYALSFFEIGAVSIEGEVVSTGGGGVSATQADVRILVFLSIGQSNMQGHSSGYDANLDKSIVDVYQWGSSGDFAGEIAIAREPLSHITEMANPTLIGPALSFAKEVIAQSKATTRILLVPAAMGGTGFSDDRWGVGDDLYLNAIARANAALASVAKAEFAGFLWLQGEKDAQNSLAKATYISELDAMIAGMRAAITGATNAPFFAGEMVNSWAAGAPERIAIQEAIQDLPNRVNDCYLVSTAGLDPQGDGIHYSAASMRLLGPRYATKYLEVAQVAATPPAIINITRPIFWADYENSGTIENKSHLTVTMTPTTITTTNEGGDRGYVTVHTGSGEQILVNQGLTISYTKMAWVKLEGDPANPNVISTDGGNGQHTLWLPGTSKQLTAGHGDNLTIVQDPVPLSNDVWYHVAVTYDDTSRAMTIYKNKVPVGTANIGVGNPWDASNGSTRIGAYQASDNCWDGNQDEHMIFDYALTAQEISAIYDGNYQFVE